MEQTPPQAQPPQQAGLHQSDADDDDENVKQLNECSSLYLSLQDCIVKSNRNWKSCQMEVQALKACNERRKK
ncbi:peptide methionine sulfoxide reductase B5-like [Fagus crenata]